MSLPTGPALTNGSAPHVLIVEDDAATRRLYKFMLTNGGYPVLEAEDGVTALEQLAKHPCDLVITDMNMPRMDGMELIQAIRRDHNDVYVILITAFGTPDTEKQARPLTKLPSPELQAQAWEQAQTDSGKAQPSNREVDQAVSKVQAQLDSERQRREAAEKELHQSSVDSMAAVLWITFPPR